jgi:hypothetical protein
MVDRQTPTVVSDEDTAREAEATREAEARLDADHEGSVRRMIESELSPEAAEASGEAALFDARATRIFQERWLTIQAAFVDKPGKAVEQAEALVTEVIQDLTEGFERQRRDLEARGSGGDDRSTEELRQAFRRYRSFFNRLLSV